MSKHNWHWVRTETGDLSIPEGHQGMHITQFGLCTKCGTASTAKTLACPPWSSISQGEIKSSKEFDEKIVEDLDRIESLLVKARIEYADDFSATGRMILEEAIYRIRKWI